MAQKHRFNNRKRGNQPMRTRRDDPPPVARPRFEKKPPVQFGKPFVLLEDQDKNTFEYARGAWIPYAMTIAECRLDCQVTELPQKVNGKTRYEIRAPLPVAL